MITLYDFDEIRSKRDRFVTQTKFYQPYLKKYKMTVNFRGYMDIWDKYFQVDNLDMESLFILTKELIMWRDYFVNLKCMFKMKYTASINKRLYLESFINKQRKNKLLENKILNTKDETIFFKEYLKLLTHQEKNFNKAAKHCLQLYDEGTKTYIKSI